VIVPTMRTASCSVTFPVLRSKRSSYTCIARSLPEVSGFLYRAFCEIELWFSYE
jgi:hypothetical protein